MQSIIEIFQKMSFFNGMLNMLLILFGLSAVIYWYLQHQFNYWSRKGVSFIKPHLVFGNFEGFYKAEKSTAERFLDIYDVSKGEPYVGVWEFFIPKLLIREPELVRTILVKDSNYWVDRGIATNEDVDPLSGHLANLEGRRWKAVRSKLSPTFTSSKLKQMFHLLSECGDSFERNLKMAAESEKPVEVREMSARFATDVIGSCVFGIQMNSQNDEDAEFRKIGKMIFVPLSFWRIRELIQTTFPKLFRILKVKMWPQKVTEFFLRFIGETLEYREKNDVRRHDFIDSLRNLKHPVSGGCDADDIEFDLKLLAAQAFLFFIGGFETTSTAMSYCMHELAVNQDVQQRLRDEVHEMKAKNDGKITIDALKDMKYLDMVFKEALRKYPPIPWFTRVTTRPYTIPGTKVNLPAGMIALIPVHAIHHDPKYYPEPEKFDPERFSEEAMSQRHPFAYIPFGGGPRICIGYKFGMLQSKLGLAKVVDKFEVSLCEKSQNPLKIGKNCVFLAPEKGIWLRVSAI